MPGTDENYNVQGLDYEDDEYGFLGRATMKESRIRKEIAGRFLYRGSSRASG